MGMSSEKVTGSSPEISFVQKGFGVVENEILKRVREGNSFTIPLGTKLGASLEELTRKLLYTFVLINDGTGEIKCQLIGISRRYVQATDEDQKTRKFYFSEPDDEMEERDIIITPYKKS